MSAVEQFPLVSVIVPCYNYAAYVGEALQSVLSQRYPNYELIVIDDGSSDASVATIEAALAAFQGDSLVRRVAFIRQSNQGVSAALNAGLAVAQGEFVTTFDADDVMPLGRLELQVEYLLAHPVVGCLGGRAIRIDEQGRQIPRKIKNRPVKSFIFAEVLAAALCVGGNVAIYRREAMLQAGGYDPQIKVQDLQMTLRIAHAGYRIDVLAEIVTLYREHGESLSKRYKSEYAYALKAIEPYRGHACYASAKASLINKALSLAVIYDKPYAWSLFKQVPVRYWNRKLLRRFRHFLLKKARLDPLLHHSTTN